MNHFSKFDPYIKSGLIGQQISPCGKLILFNYTDKCTFERAWDEVTLNARGSVYEIATGKLVARAFPKFFNWGELSQEERNRILSLNSFESFEKADGSNGIVFYYDGEWRINTRGSFTSDQAIKGKELLKPYEHDLDKDFTYIVEIIYPENRIVVDYKGLTDLVFITSFRTATGEENNSFHPFKKQVGRYSFDSISELQSHLLYLTYNEEGYVVRFSDGTRVKFKGDEYIKMHKIVTNISPLTIWESMNENGKVDRTLLESIPEEFSEEYIKIAEKLEKSFEDFHQDVVFRLIKIHLDLDLSSNEEYSDEYKKQVGLYMKDNPHDLNKFVFPMILNKNLGKLIKNEIRPKGNVL